jgi:putative ubiquitin-RnfH superfamily antitoxin RatB of RatAB toxin-antitoxin module
MTARSVRVEVAYALAERQRIIVVEVPAGSRIRDVIERSGIQSEFPEIDIEKQAVGVFGRKARLDDAASDGDRVEIYRDLLAAPMMKRRQRGRKSTAD